MAKKNELQKLLMRSKRGLKNIFTSGRSALITGLLASFGFLIVSGFLDLFPGWLQGTTKIFIGIIGVVVLGLIGIGKK